jgi:hypothetical protein
MNPRDAKVAEPRKNCEAAEAGETSNGLSKVSTTFSITLSESPLTSNLTMPCPVSLGFVWGEYPIEVRSAVANSTFRSGRLMFSSEVASGETRNAKASLIVWPEYERERFQV